MSLLGEIITVAQLADAALPDLEALFNAIVSELKNRDQTAAIQAAIAAVDTAVDVNEDLKFPKI